MVNINTKAAAGMDFRKIGKRNFDASKKTEIESPVPKMTGNRKSVAAP